MTPDVVLDWRESELALWSVVAEGYRRRELLREMVLLSCAVWDPKRLPDMLGERGEPVTQRDVRETLARAEEIARMRMRPVSIDEVPTKRGR